MRLLKILSISFLVVASIALAQEGEKQRELPRSGTLSATGMGGGEESVSLPGSWGFDPAEAFDTEKSPITGSVFRGDGQDWKVNVVNNSDDRYSANLEVIQYDASRRSIKRDSFGVTLSGHEKSQRTFRARTNAATAELKLSSWKNLSPKQAIEVSEDGDGAQAGK